MIVEYLILSRLMRQMTAFLYWQTCMYSSVKRFLSRLFSIIVLVSGILMPVTFAAEVEFVDGSYLIVDISGGPNATTYPVTTVDTVPADLLTNDEYKTTKIVLRHIPAGSFIMGSPIGEVGRGANEDQRHVTLTQDYYIGVFEVTQAQWLNVIPDGNREYLNQPKHPVEKVTWDNVRGVADDGSSGSDPASTSFMGLLRSRTTGLAFDLPTEAQWEYACRAGTVTALNNGLNLSDEKFCINLSVLGKHHVVTKAIPPLRPFQLPRSHDVVGSYLPNRWGIYDMHSNVMEWCLDVYQASLGTVASYDPSGPDTGSVRVLRGITSGGYARGGRSASRVGAYQYIFESQHIGFRLSAMRYPQVLLKHDG